jgi:hypothetical protein
MSPEVDEFGIPIRKAESEEAVDEFGIPIKKKDQSEEVGVFELEGTSSESPKIEELSTPLQGKNIYKDLQDVSSVTEDQLQEIDAQVLEDAKEEYGFFGGADEELPSATSMRHGVRLTPTRQETYDKNKKALTKEFAEMFDLEEGQVGEEELKGYYLEKKKVELISDRESRNREEYISNLSSEDKDALEKKTKSIRHSKLLDQNKTKILAADQNIAEAKGIIDNLEDTPDNPVWLQRAKSAALIKEAHQSYDEVASNTEGLGTVDEELDLFKRNYGVLENFLGKAFVATGDMLTGIKRAVDDIVPSLDPSVQMAKLVGLIDVYEEDVDLSTQVQEFNKEVNDNLSSSAEQMRENLRKTKSVTEIESVGDLGEWALDMTAETVHTATTLLVTGGTSGLAILSSSAYGNKIGELEKEEDLGLAQYTPLEKRTAAATVAASEFLFERVSLGILNKAKRTVTSSLKGGAVKELKDGTWRSLNLKLGKEVVKDANKEGVTEALTQISENVVDKYMLDKEGVKIYDGAVDAYASGAFMGGLVYKTPQIGGALIKPFTPKDTQQKIGENLVKINELTKGVEDLPKTTRAIVEEQVAVLDVKNEKLLAESLEVIDNLEKSEIKEVLRSEGKMYDIRKKYGDIKNDETLDETQKEIVLNSLNNDYKKVSKEKNKIVSDKAHELEIKKSNPELLTKVEEDKDKTQPVKTKSKDAVPKEESKRKEKGDSKGKVSESDVQKPKSDGVKKDVEQGEVKADNWSYKEGKFFNKKGVEYKRVPSKVKADYFEREVLPKDPEKVLELINEIKNEPVDETLNEIVNKYSTTSESFNRFSDKSLLKGNKGLELRVINNTKGLPLDIIAQEVSEIAGTEVSPEQVAEELVLGKEKSPKQLFIEDYGFDPTNVSDIEGKAIEEIEKKLNKEEFEAYKLIDEKTYYDVNEFKQEIRGFKKAPEQTTKKAVDVKITEGSKKVDLSESLGLNKADDFLKGLEDSLKDFGKENLSSGMPVVVAQGAVKAMRLAIKTAKTGADVMSTGINYVKNTDWFKGLTSEDQNNIIDNFEETLQESVKKPIVDKKKESKGNAVKDEKSFELEEQSSLEKSFERFRIKFQDKLYGVRALQSTIEKQKGRKQENIKSDFDKAETLLHGKAGNDLNKLERKVEDIAKSIAKSEFSLEQVSDYMYAKHAEERNNHIQENIDPKNASGSGMSTKQANEIIESYDSKQIKKLRELTKPLYDIVENTRKNLENYGLMSKKDVDGLRGFYSNYVPLQGFAVDEKNGSEILNTGGSGASLSVKGKEFKSVTGRKTKAGDVVSQVASQNAGSIIRGSKNEVTKTLYNLAKENPNSDVWRTFSEGNLPTKTVIIKGKPQKRPINVEGNDDYVGLKIDGKRYYIEFENKGLARSINAANAQKANLLTKAVGVVNRYLSATMTTLNPEFVISNFARDIQTALYNQMSESDIAFNSLKGKQFVKKTVKSIPISMKEIYRNEQGKTPKNKEVAKYYDEFKEDGAKTAWFYAKKPDELKKDIENIIKLHTSSGAAVTTKKGFNSLMNLIENVNTSVENAVRLASYMEARKAGVERTDAAKYAKELTVNFNRSGEYGQLLNTAFLFFNASMQGTARFAKSMATLKKNVDESGNVSYGLNKAQKLAGGVAIFSSVLTLLNQSMSDDDEDGESFYKKIPDYEKERNMIIMSPFNGKDYFKIPLPYGYNLFNNIGTMLTEVSTGERTPGNAIGFLTNSILGSFAPLPLSTSDSADKTLMKSVVPTVLKPFLELAINESYFNSPIYNENFAFGIPKPDSELGRRTTPQAFKNISSFLNEATGGSKFRSGSVDINPDKMRYLFDFALGGTGRFFGNTSQTIGNLVQKSQGVEEDLPVSRIPFVRKLYGEPSKYVNQGNYYERKDEVNQLYKEFREGDVDKTKKLYRGVVKLKNTLKKTEKAMKHIRKLKDEARNIEDAVKKSKKLNELDKRYYKQISKFNKKYNNLRK